MGGGKGPIDHYVTPVKAGRVIIEMGGKCEFVEVSHVFNCYLLIKYLRYTVFMCIYMYAYVCVCQYIYRVKRNSRTSSP
jgi:hypothetical protein